MGSVLYLAGCFQGSVEALRSIQEPTHFTDFVVAEDSDGIEGAVGLEKYDSVALLRSAVVAPNHRGSGVGRQLVEQVMERAEEAGISELYLLTTTAENYFPRFGFTRTTRAAVPDELKASAEFRGRR